jgi:pimeloyl-ACP methyl ester carboxylesterase
MRLYHEINGEGDPLVLLPGGLQTIDDMKPLIAGLAGGRKVIAVELQGHGRTADIDRPVTFEAMADDVAGLIEQLGVGRADVFGYSLGGGVALRTAIQHPERVNRLVLLSTPFRRTGWYPEALEGMKQVNASSAGMMNDMPTAKYARQWPDPGGFPKFLDKVGALLGRDYDWSTEVKDLTMPVMLIYADHDAISMAHVTEFFALLGGGLTDAGWERPTFSNGRLAILPGYTHYDVSTAPELAPAIAKFLSPRAAPLRR